MPVVGGMVLAKNLDGMGYVPWSLIPGQVSGSVARPFLGAAEVGTRLKWSLFWLSGSLWSPAAWVPPVCPWAKLHNPCDGGEKDIFLIRLTRG